jgi:transposase
MPTAYSKDLHKRVMAFSEMGGRQAEAVERFSVSRSNVPATRIQAAACALLVLPPYSPDLNHIEHAWPPLKHHYAKIPHFYIFASKSRRCRLPIHDSMKSYWP